MNPEELEKYVRKKLRRGYPAGELENELLSKGFNKEAIHNAMNNPKHQWDISSTRKNMLAIKEETDHFSFSLFLCLSASRIFFFSKFFVRASVKFTPV